MAFELVWADRLPACRATEYILTGSNRVHGPSPLARARRLLNLRRRLRNRILARKIQWSGTIETCRKDVGLPIGDALDVTDSHGIISPRICGFGHQY